MTARKAAALLALVLALTLAAPASALHDYSQGLILAGGINIDCNQVVVTGTAVGISTVCFDKPAGTTGFSIENTSAVSQTVVAIDEGTQVRVTAFAGVVNQSFDIIWQH